MAGPRGRTHSAALGIHFGHARIRLAELRGTGASLSVTAAGSVDLRPGFMSADSPVSTDDIAAALRGLIQSTGASARVAFLSVPSGSSIVRSFTLPQMPEDELSAVVDGELRHQELLTETGGAFDYFPLNAPVSEGEIAVVAHAADDPILWKLSEVAKRAGLKEIYLVPEHIGAMHACLVGKSLNAPQAVLSVAADSSDFAVVAQDGVALYRRLDVRGRDLILRAPGIDDAAEAERKAEGLAESDIPAEVRAVRGGTGSIDPVIAERLITEAKRSIEYLRRTDPVAGTVTNLLLAVTDDRFVQIAPAIEGEIAVTCETAGFDRSISGSATGVIPDPKNVGEYAIAIGLPIAGMSSGPLAVPDVRLAVSERRVERVSGPRAGLLPALVTSAVLLFVLGLAWAFFWYQGRVVSQQNDRLYEDYVALEAEYLPEQEELQNEVAAISQLAGQGVPFGPILDEVALSLDPRVGLDTATFDLGGRIVLEGQAESEEAIVATLDQLRLIGGFVSTFVESFENRDGRGLRYRINSTYDLRYPAEQALMEPNEFIPPVEAAEEATP